MKGDIVLAVRRTAGTRRGQKGRYPFSFLRKGEWMLHDTYRRGDANTNVRVRTSGIRRLACCTGRIAAASTTITTTTTTITTSAAPLTSSRTYEDTHNCLRRRHSRATYVDLCRFYCRRYGMLRFTNAARTVVALGFSPRDGISLFPPWVRKQVAPS